MTKRIALTVSLCMLPSFAFAGATDFVSSGSDKEVTAALNAFRASINGGANANVAGSFLSGRREINWDGVPDTLASPNAFPFDFFNQPNPGRARGAEFFTAGSGFLVSADNDNPTGAAVNFGDIDPSYGAEFRAFSQQRLFAANGSTITNVRFYIPGQSQVRATTTAFGVIFCDVDIADETRLEYYDQLGRLIHTIQVPASSAGQGGFSFAGAVFAGGERIWRVAIKCGTRALGGPEDVGAGVDIVVMDDFAYAEPVPATNPEMFGAAGSDAEVTAELDRFRESLGTLNANTPGSVGSGRREINWDAAPDGVSSPNALPPDFFNADTPGRARGTVFSTPGSGFEVSADDDNPTATPPDFAHIDPSYAALFRAFTPQRLFTSIGSNITEVDLFVPGSSDAADTNGFGAVFTDVDLPTSARIDWLDRNGGLLASVHAPVGSAPEESFSFLGAKFEPPYRVASIRITAGSSALGAGVVESVVEGLDLVVMDDFIYGEPVLLSSCPVDLDHSGVVNSSDFFTFLTLFFAQSPAADFNADGVIDSNDFYNYLSSFFAGC